MLIDAICSLGSDAGGRLVEDTGYLLVCPGGCSVEACQEVGLGIALEKLVADLMTFTL